MACIDRNPNCGIGETGTSVPEPLPELAAVLAVIGGVLGAIGALASDALIGIVAALGGAFAGGAIAGALAVIGVIVVIFLYGLNRCLQGEGLRMCIAGCVSNVQESFSEATEEIFPFTGQHTRVDVTVKSFFWDFVEQGSAYVFCTDEAFPRRSEIMRCYYYTKRVCNAITGSMYGAAVGGVAGIIAGAAIVAAIGCATVILCLIALLLAAIVAIVAALVGAFAGGQIVKAASDDSLPTTDTGSTISTGDLVTVKGNMQRRDFDEAANVLWWATSTSLHGRISDGTPQPFSYCEIDEQLATDGCPRATPEPPEPEPEPPK